MLRNMPNRAAWYESLGIEKEEDKRIILAEFVIEDLQLIPDSFPAELQRGPIVVYFKLWDLNPIEFRQEFILECISQTCDFYRTGKAVVLSLTRLPEIPPTMVDLVVEVKREVQECACVHEFPLAMTKIDLNPLFSDLRNEYMSTPCKVPIIKFQKDWYVLTTDETGAIAAGTIDVSIRLSSFDNFAVSHMTVGTQEAVLSMVPKRQKRIYTCQDFEHLDPIKLCSSADDPFEACDLSIHMLDGIMTAATSGIPDDIDNWIALAQHQGWKPQPKPIIEKAEAEAILSTVCPDHCFGFHPRYPRPRYSKIRGDTTRPPECTEVCPTYEDAFKPFPVCPKKRKKIEEFLENRKPCPDVCPLCYFDHDPSILPANLYMPEFTEEEGEEDFPFPFEYFPFPFEKDDEPLGGDPEDCDISCPWWSEDGKKKRQRKSFQFFKDGLKYERNKCPEQCPDCFYDKDFAKPSSSSSGSLGSSGSVSMDKKSKSRKKRKDKRRIRSDTSSSSRSSSISESTVSVKSAAKVDCKCVHPDEPPENKYPCLSSYQKYLPDPISRREQGDSGRGKSKRMPQKKDTSGNRASRSQQQTDDDRDSSAGQGDTTPSRDSDKRNTQSQLSNDGDEGRRRSSKKGRKVSREDGEGIQNKKGRKLSKAGGEGRNRKDSQQSDDEGKTSKKGRKQSIEDAEGNGNRKGSIPNEAGEGI